MIVSGSLHFYSGDDKELFFVFDDVVAQDMYRNDAFVINDPKSRRAYISVGNARFIHERTLSFSRKQTEIKVSLCSRNTKDGLGPLTELYDWFANREVHPAPFGLLGHLTQVRFRGALVWELALSEPEDLVSPPGLPRRSKTKSRERRSFERRREILQNDLTIPGRLAERLALRILAVDFALPDFECFWRDRFLDSERIEIRKMGIIADIDVWNVLSNEPIRFVEVKAQKIIGSSAKPIFHLSVAEWRSYHDAKAKQIAYEIWLFQYQDLGDLKDAPDKVNLLIFDQLQEDWIASEGYIVTPPSSEGRRRKLGKIE